MNPVSYYSLISIALIVLCFFSARFSLSMSLYKVFGLGMLFNCVWVFIVKNSKDLILDAIIYDVMMVVFYTTALMYLNKNNSLTLINYIGFSIIVVGYILFQSK